MNGNDTFTFKRVVGKNIAAHVDELARLRIEVFREFPYLYDGDEEYERKYLQTYVNSPRSLAVLVYDGVELIGASTGLPMQDETAEFQRPFVERGYDVAKVFYCGESVLRGAYRGRGIYKHLFQAREQHAAGLPGIELCTFCGVRRAPDHPLRPADYSPLDAIWQRFGYTEQAQLETSYTWKDIDQSESSAKTMRFWTKPLAADDKPVAQAFRIAAAQYPIEFLGDWARYEAKIARWVDEAARNGARLLLFPEYFSMELASLFPAEIHTSLPAQLPALQSVLPRFLELFAAQAKRHDVIICAGSFPVRVGDGYRNRSYLFHGDGRSEFQEKLQMTRFENEQWLIQAGGDVRVFDTALGRIAINVCYDSEFPLIARRQVEMGADLILVPSCTDTVAGYWRVRIGSQARALENQCYVVQASTVGSAPWSPAVDVNVGAAAIYTPVDRGFPDDGVLASGTLNAAQWVYADVDLGAIVQVRSEGQVFNFRDWPGQLRLAK
jgi:predicted amidohydrolase/GNAT superfamily N-acetyltransferase